MLLTFYFVPGSVPCSFSNFLERRNQDDDRPTKRRKVTGPRSLSQANGLSESGIPLGYIPVARFVLDLVRAPSSALPYGHLTDFRIR